LKQQTIKISWNMVQLLNDHILFMVRFHEPYIRCIIKQSRGS
jgi:hypothetical protein